METKTYGEIDRSDPLILKEVIGTATDKNGNTFEMAVGFVTKTPFIRHIETKNIFTLTWENLVHLAIDHGIMEKG